MVVPAARIFAIGSDRAGPSEMARWLCAEIEFCELVPARIVVWPPWNPRSIAHCVGEKNEPATSVS